ncbi:MAG TPA: ABC transporter permease [Vicinamibacterales bacterium]|nr:ABC transporter permease [Vicinamibacterales bacterium]
MRRLRAVLARVVDGLFRRRDRDFDEELASHFQLHIDDNVRAGMSPDEARRAALVKFGGVEAVREAHRDRRGFPAIDALVRDSRDALRFWRRHPTLAVVAVLSLALGIGANTAIFSIVNGLVLRDLPVADPGRLVHVLREPGRGSFSNPLWETIRDDARGPFESAAAWYATSFNLSESGETRYVRGIMTSGGFFDVLGVRPAAGRLLTSSDDHRVRGGPALESAKVAVISHGFWQRQFGGAADVIGASLRLDGVPFTIVGVTPPGFFGAEVGRAFDVAVPLAAEQITHEGSWLDQPSTRWLQIVARLNPGQTIDDATNALRGVQPKLRAATIDSDLTPQEAEGYLRLPMDLEPARAGISDMRQTYQRALTVVMGVVGIVLLIACTNLASLLLARADSRRHEMSLRMALGASRARLIRQLLIESLLITAAGALLALVFATWGSQLLLHQITRTPALDVGIDWRVLVFTIAVAGVAGAVFGLAPAARATGVGAREAIVATTRTMTNRGWLGGALVAVQVALSLMLIVGAGLFVRTFASLTAQPLGFDARSLLFVGIDAARSATPPNARLEVMLRIREAVGSLPGVADASLSMMTPLAGGVDWLIDNPPGLSLPESSRASYVNSIGPEWFHTYGMSVRSGRGLTADDTRPNLPLVVVVNDAFERRFFPGRSALGQTVRRARPAGLDDPPPLTVVGVVTDAVYEFLKAGPPPTLYLPLTQSAAARRAQNGAVPSLTVRAASGDPAALGPAILSTIVAIDPRLSLTLQPIADRVDASVSRERLLAMLGGFFGGLALLLAALGLYGVVSYNVSRRRREIAIRLALGAAPARAVVFACQRVAVVVAIGLVAGAAASAWASRFVDALLFRIQPRDPATLVGAVAILVSVAAIASWLPARRASRLDPTVVLREEQ